MSDAAWGVYHELSDEDRGSDGADSDFGGY